MRALVIAAALALGACTPAQNEQVAELAPEAGQLFCRVQTKGGGTAIVALVKVVAAASGAPAAPVAVLAVGAGKKFVDAACNAAGGVPTAPPKDGAVKQVAIVPPDMD